MTFVMHELSVAIDIIDIVKQYLPDDFESSNISVKVQIGKMRNIMLEALQFGFEALTKGTNLESAKLEIEQIPLTVKCKECDCITEIEPTFFFCFNCNSNNVVIETGNELLVKEIEIFENKLEPV